MEEAHASEPVVGNGSTANLAEVAAGMQWEHEWVLFYLL
jgi:hypothetical protein